MRVLNNHIPFFSYDYFGGLIGELATAGYQEGVDLFVFPYDWRRGVAFANTKLADRVAFVKSQTGSDKVDIVAHSMGGLVVEYYLSQHPTDHSIAKLILIGTPYLGAPKALKALLWGDTFNFSFLLNQQKMKKLVTNMPSIYDLLPSRAYYSEQGGYYYDLTTGGSPRILDFSQLMDLISARGLNGAAATAAALVQDTGLTLPPFSDLGVEAYNTSGCDAPTITCIIERPNNE